MPGIFLIHQDGVVAKAFQEALGANSGFQLLGQAASGGEANSKLGAIKPDIVFVQIALPDTDGFSLISSIQNKLPGVYAVPVLQGGEGGDIWQRIFQAGLRDVLVPPFNTASVLQAARQAQSNAALSGSRGVGSADGSGGSYSVVVSSARGGVGKSIFATNLAVALARRGGATTLFDFSMAAGDFFTMLDQVPRHTMADAIGQGLGLDVSLLRNLVSDHSLGFKFLACPNEDFDFYGFDFEQARNFVNAAREISDYLIFDTGAYDLPMTSAAVEEADLIYLLSTRDLARLLSTQRLIKNFASRNISGEKIKVIVNNAEVGMEISDAEVEEVLAHPVTAYLPSVPAEAAFSINSGKPLIQSNPDHPLAAVIDKLAEYTLIKWDDKATT
jgi:pilus assembly protein CpaE